MRTLLAVGLVALLAGPAGAIGVTTCGQAVLPGQVGVLAADLDCRALPDGPPFAAVQLHRGATLELQGHAILGREIGVACLKDCSVVGPGEITETTVAAIGGGSGGRVTITGLSVHDNGGIVNAPLSRVVMRDTIAARNRYGIWANGLTATNVSVIDSAGDAILVSRRFVATDVSVVDSQEAGVTALGGLQATRVTVSGSLGAGVVSRGRVVLVDSSVTGSVYRQWDILSVRRPRLLGTSTCGHSFRLLRDPANPQQFVEGSTWGVCAHD